MYTELKDKKQLKLNTFCSMFDVPRSTAILWYNTSGFPMYKISGRWFVDLEEYYVWRKEQLNRDYEDIA